MQDDQETSTSIASSSSDGGSSSVHRGGSFCRPRRLTMVTPPHAYWTGARYGILARRRTHRVLSLKLHPLCRRRSPLDVREPTSGCVTSAQGLICAGIVQYGLPALILEAVRRTGSSCCHNGGTLCSLCGWFYENVKKVPNCYDATDAFLKLKMHHNSFSDGTPPRTPLEKLTTLPGPVVDRGGDTPFPFPSPRSSTDSIVTSFSIN